MNRRAHAMLARALVAACGGLEEAAGACRVQKSQLADYQSPQGVGFMPADVIADLEAYCGSPFYSRGLAAAFHAHAAGGLLVETMEVNEAASDLQRAVRTALEDGEVSEAERRDLAARAQALQRELADVVAILGGGD